MQSFVYSEETGLYRLLLQTGKSLLLPVCKLQYSVAKLLKARANERNMLRQHVGYNMLRSFVHHVGLCCMMLVYVAFSLKPVKRFAQHMPTFLLFSGDR